jgi:hypothetical protein
MTNRLSIIPFLRPFALALLLMPTAACYDKDDVYAPAEAEVTNPFDADDASDVNASDGLDEAPDASFEDSTDEEEAAPEEDAEEDAEEFQCVFGKRVADMPDADHLALGSFEHLVGIDAMSDFELDQLLFGTDAFDWFDAAGALDDFFAQIDSGRVLVRRVDVTTSGQAFTHLRFHSRDSEYGFLFLEDSLRLVAVVDDGELLNCTVAL